MTTLALSLFIFHQLFFAPAQDAQTVAPRAYRREFENEWVRVTRVHYGPLEKIASHNHPESPTVYLYLSDSGPVRFTHTGDEKFVIVRPRLKAGGFRLSRSVKETHIVENLTEQPSDFLRVELKNFAADRATFRGRFPPDAHATNRNSQKVRFEDARVRIVRVTCAARSLCDGLRSRDAASLLVALMPVRLRAATLVGRREREAWDEMFETGQTKWTQAGDEIASRNDGDRPAEFLRIDLKGTTGR